MLFNTLLSVFGLAVIASIIILCVLQYCCKGIKRGYYIIRLAIIVCVILIIGVTIYAGVTFKATPYELSGTIIRSEAIGHKTSTEYKIWVETTDGKVYEVDADSVTFARATTGAIVTIEGYEVTNIFCTMYTTNSVKF